MRGFTRGWGARKLAAGALVIALSMFAGGVAVAAGSPAIHTKTPHSANDITNIDVLRQQIRNYYGDPLGSGVFSNTSNYAKETRSVAARGEAWLTFVSAFHLHPGTGHRAIVLDVDDTTLATWNYEIASNWAYNPVSNATYVNGELFPAVPGMVKLARIAKAEGYAIFFITGRPALQEAVTELSRGRRPIYAACPRLRLRAVGRRRRSGEERDLWL